MHGVLVADAHARHASSATRLGAIRLDRRPFDVAPACDRDQYRLIRHQVFCFQCLPIANGDAGTPVVGVGLPQLRQIFLDEIENLARVSQQIFQIGNVLDDIRVLVFDLLPFQGGQAAQLHVEDGLSLDFAQLEAFHQACAGRLGVR